MKKYRCLREFNGNEGETWFWFIPIKGNKKELSLLQEIIDYLPEDDDNTHELMDEIVTEDEIDTLLKFNFGIYHDCFNKLRGTLQLGLMYVDDEGWVDELYKGGIMNYMRGAFN